MCSPEMLRAFLAHVSVMAGLAKGDGTAGMDAVVVSTVHQAKALEWEHVFLPHFNEGLFPMKYRGEPDAVFKRINHQLQEVLDAPFKHDVEESHIAYVAITRAKRSLYISFLEAVPAVWMKTSLGDTPKPSQYLPRPMAPPVSR
ncbi:hypothetical protein FBU59_002733 [Linderina macrospora]|uniref:Uncharacterized protein n=1 Tax=Linderina macrospora TaxID=4868 RepID=A0ACC1JAH1_9FUNG|nr:hypothetical protein FBU59_002733 [Linderina macrospora]